MVEVSDKIMENCFGYFFTVMIQAPNCVVHHHATTERDIMHTRQLDSSDELIPCVCHQIGSRVSVSIV